MKSSASPNDRKFYIFSKNEKKKKTQNDPCRKTRTENGFETDSLENRRSWEHMQYGYYLKSESFQASNVFEKEF